MPAAVTPPTAPPYPPWDIGITPVATLRKSNSPKASRWKSPDPSGSVAPGWAPPGPRAARGARVAEEASASLSARPPPGATRP